VPILGLLWIATADGANALPREQAHAIAAFLLRVDGWSPIVSAIFFAVGSTLFSWLFLRGRLIPIALAWLGVVASLILVAALPLRLAGILGEPIASLIWLPMLVFEVALALVFIIRGVPERPQQYRSDPRGGEPFRA
jgi:hypothetical protein